MRGKAADVVRSVRREMEMGRGIEGFIVVCVVCVEARMMLRVK